MRLRSKIMGMFLAGASGDAQGMAVETWTPKKILEVHPNGVLSYVLPNGHKWFTSDPNDPDKNKQFVKEGTTTDDWQLTKSTGEGLIASKDFDLDEIGKQSVIAMRNSIAGWGKTTVESIRRIANNVSYMDSGRTDEKHRGTGNGVPMKCSVLAAWRLTELGKSCVDFNKRVIDYSAMTHYTKMSAQATLCHTEACLYCLSVTPEEFSVENFLDVVCNKAFESIETERRFDHLNDTDDNFEHRMIYFWKNRKKIQNWSLEKICEEFGGGGCYVYDSLPFAYALFIQDPLSIDTITRVVNAGGDTDTNAKMIGELIGAIHGIEILEKDENRWRIDGLQEKDSIIEFGNRFCDTFGVTNDS